MYAVVEEDRACGLLFTLEDANHILIDYFAVDPQARKRQIGSRVLKQFFAAHDKPIVLEIEDPWSTEVPAERALRQRRKAFLFAQRHAGASVQCRFVWRADGNARDGRNVFVRGVFVVAQDVPF